MSEKTDKILLIAGCSHAAGAEINGSEDSVYNRSYSFGNVLARKLGRIPINIAQHGLSNQGIARVILNWFHYQYNQELQDVQVLVSWTESLRTEIPRKTDKVDDISIITRSANWLDLSGQHYMNFNFGDYKGSSNEELMSYKSTERFIVENETFMEVNSLYMVMLLQQFFLNNNIKYMMCNTMHMFTSYVKQIENLLPLIDQTKYRYMMHDGESFYIKYKNLGFSNDKAKYWHHGKEPHRLFADDLYNFIEESKCF